MRQFWNVFLFGSLLINSSRRSQKRCLRRATPTHPHSVYNICFTRGDRISWIWINLQNAQVQDAMNRVSTRGNGVVVRDRVPN
ncbi:hypothetical protein COO91_06943 [Nostoc flagelliforme CCNUN1]|uniref:Uncharacterized protein n=1 Tax=Nostoc flagelliforme CCNUN1 TaxID=2038116 RepID=A0A2K8SZN4_9NOSO|nr:hypothetical protein [Nostoc flagelliforme]AUB40907.1 hypothetical protein COO91_06943 [Nostoc flagelliforme CCNUN1]